MDIQNPLSQRGSGRIQSNNSSATVKHYTTKPDDQSTLTQYFDGNPVITTNGYAIEERVYNESGYCEYIWYLDEQVNPCQRTNGAYGRHNLYENGRNVAYTYVYADGKPMISNGAATTTRRTFYPNGKVENEFYFDEKDDPIALSLGRYGVHKEYDELGRTRLTTYLGADGSKITTKKGINGCIIIQKPWSSLPFY